MGGAPAAGAVVLLIAAVAWLALSGGEGGGEGSGERGNPPVEPRSGRVTDVIDGDTIRVAGEEESVRYIGIDTPEVDPNIGVECFGDQASQRNRELVGGEHVRLVPGAAARDRYGRLLAYVYVEDTFVNAELIEGGYARTLEIPPNTENAGLLGRLEQEAAEAGRGLWGAC